MWVTELTYEGILGVDLCKESRRRLREAESAYNLGVIARVPPGAINLLSSLIFKDLKFYPLLFT